MKQVYAELSNKVLKDLKEAEAPDEGAGLEGRAAHQLVDRMGLAEIAKQDRVNELKQERARYVRAGLKRILSASGGSEVRHSHTLKKASFSNLNIGEVDRHILNSFLIFKRKKASRVLMTEMSGSPHRTSPEDKPGIPAEQRSKAEGARPASAVMFGSRRTFSLVQKPSSAAKRLYRPKSQNNSSLHIPDSRVQSPGSKASHQVQPKQERLFSAQGPSTDDYTTDDRAVFTASSSKKEERHLLQASYGLLKGSLAIPDGFEARKRSSPNFSGFTAENPSFLKPAHLKRIISNKSRLTHSRPVVIQF